MSDLLFWPGTSYVVAALVVYPLRWVALLLLDGWRRVREERRNPIYALRRIHNPARSNQ